MAKEMSMDALQSCALRAQLHACDLDRRVIYQLVAIAPLSSSSDTPGGSVFFLLQRARESKPWAVGCVALEKVGYHGADEVHGGPIARRQ